MKNAILEEISLNWENMAAMEENAKPGRSETLRECADLLRMAADNPLFSERETGLEELVRSACAIADRKGAGTAWGRFVASARSFGLNGVTARTYRILPSDIEGGSEPVSTVAAPLPAAPAPTRATAEQESEIDAAVKAGRITFEPGWDDPRPAPAPAEQAGELPPLPTDAAAWVSPLRYGSKVTFPKPVRPEDDDEEWYCHPLFTAEQMNTHARAALAARQAPDSRDAERYRWLVANATSGSIGFSGDGWIDAGDSEEWNGFIDAAIAKEKS